MAGRRPTPTKLLEQRGAFKINPNRRRDKEPAATGKPKMPRHLDKAAKAEWKRITALLESMGVLSETDAPSIEQYCETYSEWRKAKDNVAKTGQAIVRSSANGAPTVTKNPFIAVKQAAAAQCYRYLVEFGMTPASRSRLQVEAKETGTDWFEQALRNRSLEN